jgi:hypothetical protein
MSASRRVLLLLCAALPAAAQTVVVQYGSPMKYRASSADPGLGTGWTAEAFNDSGWVAGSYGVGYEAAPPGAVNLLQTTVPAGSYSVYSRALFNIPDASQVLTLSLGADYDDGYVAWINGVEVFRSAEMPAGAPAWNTSAALHESSNGATPAYAPLQNISLAGIPALHNGANVLAIGVWNNAPASSDLVLVPRLSYTTAGTPPAVTRGPYLQTGTPSSVIIRWRTNLATDSRVRYGASPASLTQTADDAASTTEHIIAVSGLAPATTYYYSVGSTTLTLAGGDSDHFFQTSPPPGTARPYRFWVLGDSGTADGNARAVRDAYYAFTGTTRTDLWLMLGDNAYTTGTDAEFQAAVFDTYPATLRKAVLWPTYGNHDSYSANAAAQSGPYFDNFTLPKNSEAGGVASGTEAYYSFDFGNIHFICLESMDAAFRSPTGAQLTWLQQDLAAVVRPWIIAFWHHPPYSKGSHDSDAEIELLEMRQNFLPMLEQAGVDLVLSGHSHAYERTFLIDGHYGLSGTFTNAMKKDGGDGRPAGAGAYRKPTPGQASHEGAVYTVAGSSGQTGGGTLNHPAMFLSLNRLGSLVLDVNGGRLDAKFLDNTGTVADSFTLLKGAPAPRAVPDGKFVLGAPMKAAKLAADGSSLTVTWDTAGCRASTQYEILWGNGSDLSTMTPADAVCNIGQSGGYAWSGAPAVPAGQRFIWWVVAGTDGATQEGSWGKDSAGAEEHGAVPSGLCGVTAKNTANSCP